MVNIVDPASRGELSAYLLPHEIIHPTLLIVFPWCGYSIDMEDLSVSVDYARYNNTCEYNMVE